MRASFFLGLALIVTSVAAQTKPVPAAPIQRGIHLVETGRCREAMPLLKRALPAATDKSLRYDGGMAMVRCAMALNDDQTAADTLLMLERLVPNDPEVLYMAAHIFSELGTRSADQLQRHGPSSVQARRIQAEALESQGKNADAAEIYRKILAENPRTPGIHYRLGQIDLALAGDTGSTDEARKEFEAETQVDPTNASAEFVLGELDRRAGNWEPAIRHFTRAAHLDEGFSEARLALGMTLAAAGKYTEAIPPLQTYAKMEPEDPAGHYQLAMAYAHTGNKEAAAREMALQAQAARAKGATDNTEGHAVHP
jgi:predicted Zn-dependent protease